MVLSQLVAGCAPYIHISILYSGLLVTVKQGAISDYNPVSGHVDSMLDDAAAALSHLSATVNL